MNQYMNGEVKLLQPTTLSTTYDLIISEDFAKMTFPKRLKGRL